MKSKLLQKISYGVNQSREAVNDQQENIEDSSVPWRECENLGRAGFLAEVWPTAQGYKLHKHNLINPP
jgi:hypothetical protein